jgi:sialic acid synthase SpsE
MPTKKDLPAKKNVKGGGIWQNDNITLVRAAKPAKDLPANKDIKAGKKAAKKAQ